MNINDRVISRNKSGATADMPGHVVAIFQADYYKAMVKSIYGSEINWGDLYPEWEDKRVFKVMLDEPRRSATLKEWIQSAVAQGYKPDDAAAIYETNCPVMNSMDFPEDDLISLE